LLLGFAAWLLIAVETYLILDLLGAGPTFTQAIALESVASVMRILFFFIPGGTLCPDHRGVTPSMV
jgi:hypothetical protein